MEIYLHTHIHTATHRAGFQSLRGGGISSLLLRGATPRAACMMVMNFLYFMMLLINTLALSQLSVNPLSWQHLPLPTVGPPCLSLGVSGWSAEEASASSGGWALKWGDRTAVEKSQKTTAVYWFVLKHYCYIIHTENPTTGG